MNPPYTLLELFSGIGGMRTAFQLAGLKFDSVTAIDLNPNANDLYSKVFNDCPEQRDISSTPLAWFENLAATVWSMSPPCQPYTRQGNMRREQDTRNSALGRLTHVLSEIQNFPSLLVLENVNGFQDSVSCRELVSVLRRRGMTVTGYLINPLDHGFPNSRLRFYLVGVRTGEDAGESFGEEPLEIKTEFDEQVGRLDRPIAEFLNKDTDSIELEVPLSVLSKPSSVCFDIVAANSTQSLCFTSNYGRLVKGAGSVLLITEPQGIPPEWDHRKRPIFNLSAEEMPQLAGCLRYFAPEEIARLQGFKAGLEVGRSESDVPDFQTALKSVSTRVGWKLLGNSLNPRIVCSIVSDAMARRP